MIGELRFAGGWSPGWVFAVTTVMVLAVMAIYLRETRTLASPYRWLLPALRGSAVALVVLILAGPVWYRRQVIGTLGHVTFALDVSRSMSLTDSADADPAGSRLRRATRLLGGEPGRAGWIETLRPTHEIDVVAFAEGRPRRVWSTAEETETLSLDVLEASGTATDLASALEGAFEPRDPIADEQGRPATAPTPGDAAETRVRRSAVVLLSDGRDTTGRSATDAARRGGEGTAVHAVGIGSDQEPQDLGVLGVTYPESVAADGRLTGEIVLKHQGFSGDEARLRVEAFAETVWGETVPITGDGRQTVPFEIEIAPLVESRLAGVPRRVRRNTVVLELRAIVEPLPDEMTNDNNARDFRVAASIRDRRLLVLDGSSRWEVRYLRNLFERDPRWQVDTVLFGPGTDTPVPTWGDNPGELPATREALARYDAVIVGEIDGEVFDEAATYRLQDFVTRGGGLILVDGRYDRIRHLADRGLGDLLPVRHESAEPDAGGPQVRFVVPTAIGRDHPILNLMGRTEDLGEFWRRLPAPAEINPVVAKDDAEVWAEALSGDGRRYPWLVTRLYGSGRVFYLAAGETWRWRYKVADRFHSRFWNQLVQAAMQPPYSASDDFVALGTDRVQYAPGQRSSIRARLQDTRGEPVGDATVDAILVRGDEVVATVPLSVDDTARGTYTGLTAPLEVGGYDVRIRAAGFDSAALQASTPIWVEPPPTAELDRVSLDRQTLQRIADVSGGLFVDESSADRLLEELRPLSTGRIVESDFLLWQSYYWFAAVLILLTIEWWLRKRAGLV